jgi:2-hydroxychromene-2-carboxylate isomerase
MTVEFFFGPGSRYSYLAASRMAALGRDTGATIRWRPVSSHEMRALRGADPFAGPPVSGQYDWDYRRYDAECWAEYYGIRFREPPSRDVDFRLLGRAAVAGARLGRAAEYGWAICRTVYGSDVWPLDEAACLVAAREVGLAETAFTEALHDPATDRTLTDTAHEAVRRGAFGVPTFFVGERMFWGNDRLVLVRHALGASSATG